MTSEPLLVLASNSPRRRQLLTVGGWKFEVFPADVDESRQPGESPVACVTRLAETKARVVASFYPNNLVLAADTIVVDGEEVLGKPVNAFEAENILQRLSGHVHQVYTAIALLRLPEGCQVTDVCLTPVPMRNFSNDEIKTYVASGDPMDKAGAYAIQHPGFHPVESLAGCYASVMGLPLCHLVRSLRRFGVAAPENVPAACQAALEYTCPVFQSILGA